MDVFSGSVFNVGLKNDESKPAKNTNMNKKVFKKKR